MELRTAAVPTGHKDGTYKGGTTFERSSRTHGVKSLQCYTNAFAHQVPPNIVSVTADSKRNGVQDNNLALRSEVNLVRYCRFCVIFMY
jgi:hypothetical protein